MFRISKLADYAIVVMRVLAEHPHRTMSATELVACSYLPDQTVRKILKKLTIAQLLISQRGANGGYRLRLPVQEISLLAIIAVFDGPLHLTSCCSDEPCEHLDHCPMPVKWQRIHHAVMGALEGITLADLLDDPGHGSSTTGLKEVPFNGLGARLS
ncbi:SUF system Fe-S cluster assembly regulator [Magnetococcus sp. PR-3]|uniref:SUF system Fe-S cluster assembly regulator n=1 Tax=Magnetococcus sp. PR-3 TaxID=3120355 RepID=UPI002FCE01ED